MRVVGKRNRDVLRALTYEQVVGEMLKAGMADPGSAPQVDCASLSPRAPDPMPARERRYWAARGEHHNIALTHVQFHQGLFGK